jgi:diadenosine tetraphosphate (Ap4A) HIT family hydrolase
MNNDCLICQRINDIKNNSNPYFVKELETGYVVIGDYQTYEGYTLFLCKLHISEIHEFDKSFKLKFLTEMALVGEAVYHAFKAIKVNYELLGNTEKSHIHWHYFPRRASDPKPTGPVWIQGKDYVYNKSNIPSSNKLSELKKLLQLELNRIK